MKLHFLGANRQVTGSRYCLETTNSRVLIDCGLFQERQYTGRNWIESPLPPDSVDAMVVTHAHIDHCGLVPRFVKQGFNGPIYCTLPTSDLLDVMLNDAAHIQSEDAKYKARRHKKKGSKSRFEPQPLFDQNDVRETLQLVNGHHFNKVVKITDDISVEFHPAGHILGSAMLEFNVTEAGTSRRVVFSGDIGQWDKPLLRDPTMFEQADYIVMESTYGDRVHKENGDIGEQLEDVINRTLQRGGKVLIPTFAVERAQELLYFLSDLVNSKRIPNVPVFLDSPMAVDVTQIFKSHRDHFDDETWERIAAGDRPLQFSSLEFARSAEQSKAINEVSGPAIIMATSGMCTAGRIKHHLKKNIDDAKCTVLFVGYQAHGTLGRQIVDGSEEVRIHGRTRKVRAEVAQIFGFSGHADREGLLKWTRNFKSKPRRIFLTHGDEEAAESLAAQIRQELQWNVLIPHYESTTDLH